MKNKFENLLDTRKKLDEVLEVVKEQNTVLEREIEDNKSALYEQMFDDCYELYEYAKQLGFKFAYLDTGISAYTGRTIWLSLSPDKTIGLSVADKGYKNGYYYFRFTRKNNIDDCKNSCVSEGAEHLYKVLSNWDYAFNNMQDNLAEQARAKMEKDIQNAKARQEKLMNDFNKFKKGV